MIAVDTSVWIGFLRGDESPQIARLGDLLADGAPLAITDCVLTELLQGVGEEDAGALEQRLRAFPVLRLAAVDDFVLAAAMYRQARAAGYTVRKTIDCLIAAACVRAGAALLHDDRDFDRLAASTELRVVELDRT